MKKIRNLMTILIVMIFSIMIMCGTSSAATSINATSSVTVGNNVSVTVSFGGKVSFAQFRLNYDSSKFEYVSASAGQFGTATNTYIYNSFTDENDLGSVTLTFRSKATGSGTFSISSVDISSNNAAISKGSTTVTVKEATNPTTPTNPTKPGGTTTKPVKKPSGSSGTSSTRPKTSTGTNANGGDDVTSEPIELLPKPELDEFKMTVAGLVQTDYTEESWNALAQAIANAEAADTQEAYDAAKVFLTTEGLVPVEFSKDELNKVLRDLIGKVEKDYTEESWRELQEAIDIADSATLKSQYDAVKDKLTINSLILEEEKGFFGELAEKIAEMEPIVIILIATIIALVIIIIVMAIMYDKTKKGDGVGRRLK